MEKLTATGMDAILDELNSLHKRHIGNIEKLFPKSLIGEQFFVEKHSPPKKKNIMLAFPLVDGAN